MQEVSHWRKQSVWWHFKTEGCWVTFPTGSVRGLISLSLVENIFFRSATLTVITQLHWFQNALSSDLLCCIWTDQPTTVKSTTSALGATYWHKDTKLVGQQENSLHPAGDINTGRAIKSRSYTTQWNGSGGPLCERAVSVLPPLARVHIRNAFHQLKT